MVKKLEVKCSKDLVSEAGLCTDFNHLGSTGILNANEGNFQSISQSRNFDT